MAAATVNTARRFARDEDGAIAILFGLFMTAILMIMGVAIDLGRATHAEMRLTAAMDAAALSAGRALIDGALDDDEIRALALKVLDENFRAGGSTPGTLSATDVTLNRATGAVTINTTAFVPATLTAIAKFPGFTMPRTASVIFDQKDIELAIQLDITGSMRGAKLEALKKALHGTNNKGFNSEPDEQGLLDIMLPDVAGQNKVRIGLVPYAAGVNLGQAAAALVTNNRNAGSACVYDRVANVTTDAVYGAGNYFKGRADLPSAQNCPGVRISPLSNVGDNANERTRMKRLVRSFVDGGTTAGQLGTGWAWNLLSPAWKDVWRSNGFNADPPAAYRAPNTIKAVILMTDGEYNTIDGQCDNSGCTPSGPRGTRANNTARDLCENMKEQDVMVFTIGFQLNHPVAVETLNRCATSPQTAFFADNEDGLRGAFRDIAKSLTNLRLTQ